MDHWAQAAAAPLADKDRTQERRAIDKAITLQVTQISATQEQVRVVWCVCPTQKACSFVVK